MSQLRAQSISCSPNLEDHNSVSKPSPSPHKTGFFCSCNEEMGIKQPQFNGEMVERCAALRNLKLLAGNGGFEFTKGMDSLDKHVEQSSLRQGVLFSEHGQLKGRRPHFQPTVAKRLNLHKCSLVCSSHIAEVRASSLS